MHPRIMIAGVSGDCGKTLISLGLTAAWKREGLPVAVFKKGPDYIDAQWLSRAAGRPAYNLDSWMMGPASVLQSFTSHALSSGINIIEGNRGFYDGENVSGSHSSAMLARLLNAPVILILPAVKATRTVAAIAIGLKLFEKDLNIAGIIVNRVATSRQEFLIRQAIENEAGLPVLGVIPRMDNDLLPGRHLGLVPPDEHDNFDCSIMAAADLVERSVNMERLRAIAQDAAHNSIVPLSHDLKTGCEVDARGVKIGYFHNAAFTFYYPENFDAIDRAGAERIAIDPFTQQELPQVDALYIGGGFPETHAPRLADNKSFMASVVASARAGLPIWAECGGLMFLARSLMWKGTSYPMAGLLPVDVILESRPAGHGYEEVTVDCQNPFIKVGTTIRGHEFHYSRIVTDCPLDTAFSVRRGTGLGNGRDGIIVNHTLASYLHVHSVATPAWMSWIVDAAKMRRDEQAWHF